MEIFETLTNIVRHGSLKRQFKSKDIKIIFPSFIDLIVPALLPLSQLEPLLLVNLPTRKERILKFIPRCVKLVWPCCKSPSFISVSIFLLLSLYSCLPATTDSPTPGQIRRCTLDIHETMYVKRADSSPWIVKEEGDPETPWALLSNSGFTHTVHSLAGLINSELPLRGNLDFCF